ncbi:MAG: dihydrodipicolinate synthase family protein [Gammaproteobacteria bacterium]
MLSVDDIKGTWAIACTPSKPGADQWDATDTVDLDELASATDKIVNDGADGYITLGTTAECATLTRKEWEQAVECVLSTINKRIPTLIGTSALGTHEIVDRMRFIRDLGADGAILGLPMWQPCTMEMAVKFYATMSAAFPDLGIMCYSNPNAFRFQFPLPFWKLVAEQAPTVIAAKNAADPQLLNLDRITGGKIRFVPHVVTYYTAARISPEHSQACWTTEAGMGLAPAKALMAAVQAGDWDTALKIDGDLNWALQTFFPPGGIQEFASYNIQLEKIRIDEAGYTKAGPIRPPYDVIPEAYAEGARECGRRWAQLQQKYSQG